MPSTIELDQTDPLAGKVTDAVPCIRADELLESNRHKLVDAVRSACTETGFFFVELTDAQCDTLAATLDQMECFFSLDENDPRKQNVLQDADSYGWVPKYSEPAYQPGTVSTLEAFDFGLENVQGPATGIWPPLPEFRDTVTRCWSDYLVLGDAILEVVALAAGMQPDFLVERCNARSLNSMRLLYYEGDTNVSTDDEVGISAHTDFECITLLYQTAPGLELLDVNGRWLDAHARNGRLVVLLDDMLERWTNGVFKATGHRVRSTEEPRFSIVMFIAANDDIEIAPLPQFVSVSAPSRYTPTGQAQHIENEVRRARENAAARRKG